MKLMNLLLSSIIVSSVVFSGGGVAAGEDDGSYHVNSWVVEVHGGEESAARLAERHGFINHGQVSVCSVARGRVGSGVGRSA